MQRKQGQQKGKSWTNDQMKATKKTPKKQFKFMTLGVKKPLTPYNFYFKEKMHEIVHNHPEIPKDQRTKKIGQWWKQTVDRMKWIELATKDFERYERDMKEAEYGKGQEPMTKKKPSAMKEKRKGHKAKFTSDDDDENMEKSDSESEEEKETKAD